MFSMREIQNIDTDYFIILQSSSYAVTVQSRNTKHYWHILHQVGSHYATCQINHKHYAADPWHIQCNRPTLAASLKEIRAHDAFHLTRRKNHELRDETSLYS